MKANLLGFSYRGGLNVMFFIYALIQFSLAWIYCYFLEYCGHIILHNRKRFFFLFKHHFSGHHKVSRRNGMRDARYDKIASTTSIFEIGSLFFLLLVHSPLIFIFPFSFLAMIISCVDYYFCHRKSHIDVEWGKKKMPWHYDHHMGTNQHKNWGVRTDFFDKVFKTKMKYRFIKRGNK